MQPVVCVVPALHLKRGEEAVKGKKWEQSEELTEVQPGGTLDVHYSSCQQQEGLLHSLFVWNGFNSSGSNGGFTFPRCPDPGVGLKFTFN